MEPGIILQYIRGLVKKYPHWCFNVLWVGGTAFCARKLTDTQYLMINFIHNIQ